MPEIPSLKDYNAGDRINATDLDDTNTAVETLTRYFADNLRENGHPFGDRAGATYVLLGTTQSTGPTGSSGQPAPALTDCRYYCSVSAVAPATSDGGVLQIQTSLEVPCSSIPSIITAYNLTEVPAGTAVAAGSGGTAPTSLGTHNVPDGTTVLLFGIPTQANPTKMRWCFFYGARGLQVVNLTQNGGADGSSSAYATWTYDAYIRNMNGSSGAQINTTGGPLTVLEPRQLMISMIPATSGIIYYDPSGAAKLAIAFEQFNQNACTTPTSSPSPSYMGGF